MRIILATFPGWDQVPDLRTTDCYLFASPSDHRKAVIPPGWFKALRGNVNNIWAGNPRANKRKSRVLSPEGAAWLRTYARLWPFLDKNQRQDGVAFAKYDLSNLTDEQVLEYGLLVDRAFGAGHGGNQQFVEAGKEAFKQAAIRRCREVANLDPQLGEIPEVATFENVIDYLSSEKMKAAFKRGEKSRVVTKVSAQIGVSALLILCHQVLTLIHALDLLYPGSTFKRVGQRLAA